MHVRVRSPLASTHRVERMSCVAMIDVDILGKRLTDVPLQSSIYRTSTGPWTDEENDLIVVDYFTMLADDIAGLPYSKSEHNRRMQEKIDRSRKSIEFKHQNISAVLKGLGEDWIPGYRPAFHFQASLVDAVARWFAQNPHWLARTPASDPSRSLSDPPTVYLYPFNVQGPPCAQMTNAIS
ncbi:hypothetical protein FHX05_005260 [Rhizobium sp. BK491]|nr:hypothetical protein [Rhizobium sp. BK491]